MTSPSHARTPAGRIPTFSLPRTNSPAHDINHPANNEPSTAGNDASDIYNMEDSNSEQSEAEVEQVLLGYKGHKKRPIHKEKFAHDAPHGDPQGPLCRTGTSSPRPKDHPLARLPPSNNSNTITTSHNPPPSSPSSGSCASSLSPQPIRRFAPKFIAPRAAVASVEGTESDSDSTMSDNDREAEIGDTYNEYFDDDLAYYGSFRLPMS